MEYRVTGPPFPTQIWMSVRGWGWITGLSSCALDLGCGIGGGGGGDTVLHSPVLKNMEQRVMEKKQSLLKQTQKKLSDGKAINPIKVVIESKNQGGFQTKILIREHKIISDQPFGFNG